MSQPVGPQTPAGQATLAFKYAQPGETWREVSNRVAQALSDSDKHYRSLRDLISSMSFIPGGRILAGAGTTKRVTLANCFVSGTLRDSLSGPGGIMARLAEAAETMRMGGGIGYDYSPLRPENDPVRSLGSRASGPVSYIELYDAMGATISSAGERRGAQMGILRIDHPDIEKFILAKQNNNKINRFNLSIGVTDEFMECLQTDKPFDLRFEGRIYRTIDPRALWEIVMRSTWDWAEPGVVFIDRMNYWNNLNYCETIAATNPCSEQPLPPHGACVLGAMNLVKFLRLKNSNEFIFDWKAFKAAIAIAVRALDNVFDVSIWPLPAQAEEARRKRRIGLGVMGLANCLEALNATYGSGKSLELAGEIMRVLANEAYFTSAQLASEKGQFDAFSMRHYLEGAFINSALSPATIGRIAQTGLRNSHLITIAPTGTTAFMADNVSSGVEPVFSVSEDRTIETPEGRKTMRVHDYGMAVLGVVPRTANMVTPQEHVAMLCTVQRFVDSAVSKTCNVPSNTPWDAFKQLYLDAYNGGAKGCATFQVGGKRTAIRETVTECNGDACAA